MQSSAITKDQIAAIEEIKQIGKAYEEKVRECVVYGGGDLDPFLQDPDSRHQIVAENWSLDDLAKYLNFGSDKADPVYNRLKEKLERLHQNTDGVATRNKLAIDALATIKDHLTKANEEAIACSNLVERFLNGDRSVTRIMVDNKSKSAIDSFNAAVRQRKEMKEKKLHLLTIPTFLLDQVKDVSAEYDKIPKPIDKKAQIYWKYCLDIVHFKIMLASTHLNGTKTLIEGEKSAVERLNYTSQLVKTLSELVTKFDTKFAALSQKSSTTASTLSQLSMYGSVIASTPSHLGTVNAMSRLEEQKTKQRFAGVDVKSPIKPVYPVVTPAAESKEKSKAEAAKAVSAKTVAESKAKQEAADSKRRVSTAMPVGVSAYTSSAPTLLSRAPLAIPAVAPIVQTKRQILMTPAG